VSDNKLRLFLLIGLLALFLSCSEASAAAVTKAGGMFTSIENDRSVVIDKKGYLTNSATKIIDLQGRHIPLENISLPARVDIRYEHTAKGALIKVIKIFPKIIPR